MTPSAELRAVIAIHEEAHGVAPAQRIEHDVADGRSVPDPAKRCNRPQSLSACDAGRCRWKISSSTSIAACKLAPGCMTSPFETD